MSTIRNAMFTPIYYGKFTLINNKLFTDLVPSNTSELKDKVCIIDICDLDDYYGMNDLIKLSGISKPINGEVVYKNNTNGKDFYIDIKVERNINKYWETTYRVLVYV